MRKKLILVIIIWIALAIVVGIFTYHKPSHHNKAVHHTVLPTVPTNEKGSADSQPSINIQGTTALNNYLLAEQFAAVKGALDRYINTSVSPSVLTATIASGSTILNNDGSINFTVQITKPNTQFNVLLQLPNAEEIIFSVVGTNYQDALYPYATGGNTE